VGGRVLLRDGELQGDAGRARELAVAARERITATSGPAIGSVPEGVP